MSDKKKFFSLDNHFKDDLPVREILSDGRNLAKAIYTVPKIPVMTLDNARHAWGLDDFSPDELESYRVSRLTYGILAGSLFCLMIFLAICNYVNGTFGLFSVVGYTLSMLSAATVCLIFLWQADMLSGEPFVPFVTYVCKQKWLFSVIVVSLIGVSQYSVSLADPMPMPQATIEQPNDLSSGFMSMLIGKHWKEYLTQGSVSSLNLGVEMTSALLPILGCLNSMALFFVTVFALYIFTFGTVQIANTGRWEDSQIFSTFWSPLRTVAAIALCTPLNGALSALHHLILVAVALSISMGNNVTHCFLDYISGRSPDSTIASGPTFQLSAPIVPLGSATFSTFFSPLLGVVVFQKSCTNILGQNLISAKTGKEIPYDKITVDDLYYVEASEKRLINANMDGSDAIFSETGRVIKFAHPKTVNMPKIVLTANKKGNVDIDTEAEIIVALFKGLSELGDEYINSSMKQRGILKSGTLQSRTQALADAYIASMQKCVDKLIEEGENTDAKRIIELFDKMSDPEKGTLFAQFGWMTLGIYPFVIAQAQGAVQEAATTNTSVEGVINPAELHNLEKGGKNELAVADQFYAEVSKATQQLSMGSSQYNFGTVEENKSWTAQLVDMLMGIGGLSVEKIAFDLKNKNPIAVMYNKGEGIMEVGVMGLTVVGAVSGVSEFFKFLGNGAKLTGMGKLAGFLTDLGSGVVTAWTPLLTIAFGILFLFGALCCYFLPLLPMLFWARALVSWAVLIVQTFMGAPFWAAAHVLPEGIGFAGQHARRGYIMLLDLFMRPTLLCCGIIMSMLLLETITWILGVILEQWVTVTKLAAGYSFLGYFILSIIFIYIIYSAIKWLFLEAIGSFPSTVVRWCGGEGLTDNQLNMKENASRVTDQLKGMTQNLMGDNMVAGLSR